MPVAEILTIGTELLLGQIVDSNAAYLARELADAGFDLYRKGSIGDNPERIAQAVRAALERCDVLLVSGGLGPTVDDYTRDAVARATGRPLELRPELLEQIERFFLRRGRPMSDNNKRQAELPAGALPIENPVGTAPGFIVPDGERCCICLPGVPRELEHLMQGAVLPFLQQRFPGLPRLLIRTLRVAALAESEIDRRIADLETAANPTVGLAAHAGLVDIRIAARAEDEAVARALLERTAQEVHARLPGRIFGEAPDTLEAVLVGLLAQRGLTLVVLETNTGGELASRLMAAPSGPEVLREAIVLPERQAAGRILGQPAAGARAETALALARACRGTSGADLALALYGEDGDEVGPFAARPGETGLALAGEGELCRLVPLGGRSPVARAWLCNGALELLRRALLGTGELDADHATR